MKPGSRNDNTGTLEQAMENPAVDILVHLDNPAYPIDYEKVILRAKERDVLIELNNLSCCMENEGRSDNCLTIAGFCKKHGAKVVAGSDAHIAFDVGNFDKVADIFKRIDMPDELIMNLDSSRFKMYLKTKGKRRFL